MFRRASTLTGPTPLQKLSRASEARGATAYHRKLLNLIRNGNTNEAMRICEVQNTAAPAFNLLLKEILAQKKVNAAFSFWNRMKSRGYKPTSGSYVTMLHGLGQHGVAVDDSQNIPDLLDKSKLILKQGLDTHANDPRTVDALISLYLAVLDKADQPDRMLEFLSFTENLSPYHYAITFQSVLRHFTSDRVQTVNSLWQDYVSMHPNSVDLPLLSSYVRVLAAAGQTEKAIKTTTAWTGLGAAPTDTFAGVSKRDRVPVDDSFFISFLILLLKASEWQLALTSFQSILADSRNRKAVSDRAFNLLYAILLKCNKSTGFDDIIAAISPPNASKDSKEYLRLSLEKAKRDNTSRHKRDRANGLNATPSNATTGRQKR